MRGASRWLPSSLFGRLVLVLTGGLLAAQLLSAVINFAERDQLLIASTGMHQAQRVGDVVKLLDSLGPAERERVAAVLSVPPLVLSLRDVPSVTEDEPDSRVVTLFTILLRNHLGDERPVRIRADAVAAGTPVGPGPHMMGPDGGMMGRGMWRAHAGSVVRAEVQLRDGRWARFDAQSPSEASTLPWRLALTLFVLAAAVLSVSFVAVRWVTRPLHALASAATALGKDIHRPPLSEQGPVEIRQAARAFNAMQARLVRYIEDRTRVLAAMSHDLKTPLTRMRLRAEMLEDDALRERFESDLKEMETMVSHTLEFMRGLGGGELRQPVDVDALLQSLQADNDVLGREVRIEGRVAAPFPAFPSLLRRCLANLVDNAVLYGQRASVRVEDAPDVLTLRVLDEGPGLDEAELDKVFEPFYRVEPSRSRETGGTGLGLTIARDIAHTHGGELTLRNRPQGGLEAVLTLPRRA